MAKNELGKINHIISHWNVPLRQLDTKQFGAWMFAKYRNILLEQAVHPLSQLIDLIGEIKDFQIMTSDVEWLTPKSPFSRTWQISLKAQNSTSQLFYSVGQNFNTTGMTIICEDGQIEVDTANNYCAVKKKTKWPIFFDEYSKTKMTAKAMKKCAWKNLINFGLSTLKIKDRTDTFYLSMKESIKSFYATDPISSVQKSQKGKHLIAICEQMANTVKLTEIEEKKIKLLDTGSDKKFDVLLIGGTGFIGTKVTQRFINEGKNVLVAARNTKNLGEIFYHDLVTLVSADIANKESMEKIIPFAPVVIHLAHGGGGDTWEEIQSGMIAGTKNIAAACVKNKTELLMYIGTIASLYLGKKGEKITGATPCDPKPHKRTLYSKGKAYCEDIIEDLHKKENLCYCILRPGIVVGEGGVPFHSGLGIYNTDAYCIGWNKGNNPLAFVLVDDVASSIYKAYVSKDAVVGKKYNVVGDVRLTAKEYIKELSKVTGRKLHFLPQPLLKTQSIEIFKWFIKVVFQRRKVDFPSYRDIKSRGMVADFDCNDIKNDLNWKPVSDHEEFVKLAFK